MLFFFFKQKTAYEMRISDWSSDVCSSDLLAHNILRHRERLEAKGVNYGLLSGIGRNVGYFRQTELEADILSVSLLATANYDPHIALAFWHVYGPAHDSNIFNSRTPPGWATRVAVITSAIAPLDRKSTRPNSSHSCAT